MLVAIPHTILVHEIVRSIAAFEKFSDVIPPYFTNTVLVSVMLPDAHSTESFLNNVSARNPSVKIIVRIRCAVSSIIGAQVIAEILPVISLAMSPQAIVNVHVRSEIGTIPQRFCNRLEVLKKIFADSIRGDGPEIIFYTIIWGRQ
jgi:hypothetical protein